MNNPKRYTITSALPYANGPLHIGHIAGAYLPADIYVRYLRLRNRDVVFVCGSDEHGAAITLKAKKEKVAPKDIIDKYHEQIKNTFADFGIDFDIYYRTSLPLHHQTASDYFSTLLENGVFEVKSSEQYFDEEAQQFLADRYIVGTCPKCGFENAYGDQCENCGTSLSPQELINPRSTLSGTLPVLRETSHWYLPLQDHENWLREWLDTGKLDDVVQHDPSKWKKQVIGQCKSWIDGGLQSRAMTRDLDWGVKVPVEGADGKVLYVWLDAPIGYISATKAWAERENKDWKPYWQDSSTELIHFIGKDNIVFHCIIFPVLLKAHGDFILPTNVPANEFLNLEGSKISTSRNWAVWVHEYLEDFPGRQDELRYVLNAISPEFRDSEFTWADYQARVNNELVAVLGNFVNRALVLTHKFFDGKMPAGDIETLNALAHADCEAEIVKAKTQVESHIEAFRFREAQQDIMGLARFGNKVLTETEPWKLAKTDLPKAGAILNFCLQLSANLTVIARPFLPNTMAKLAEMLNVNFEDWDNAGTMDMLAEGHQINPAELLFKRIEDEEVEEQKAKLLASAASNKKKETTHMPQKPAIEFDDFLKMDIRTATILEAERVPKTDKLMKIILDTGIDKRTVVSGIAEHYTAEELPGKQVSILLNLEPRKIRGVESQGMILMAEDADGKLSFVSPGDEMANGSTVR